MVAYTGAGLSTASGIKDYASKSKDSAATGSKAEQKPLKRGRDAEPTFSHFVLTALYQAGYLKGWVQQNHDGLPQKAGFPQCKINEIHGSWFDVSNPVVPMSGSLRSDLCSWMEEEEERADLVFAMGTSLSGMHADEVVSASAKRYLEKGIGFGSVIVGFQKTKMDKLASIRIFSKIDDVMKMLVEELMIDVPTTKYSLSIPEGAQTDQPHVFKVPYSSKTGKKSKETTTWDLRVGSKIMLTAGPGKGFVGKVTRTPADPFDHYSVRLPCTREGKGLGDKKKSYTLGSWWIESCCRGEVPRLPIVNVTKKKEKKPLS
mmetsp:Transcript_14948/g.20882  ORF Transcript_14948/g.20882 Transcript_14948/m.20882 type:complete len:317 (+) Transcript_14948:272-1222(+)|eukprot:CAMPEP_0201491368 /NCGR_PEP_ID=MMETSP0151_2-20130828/29602_1 /ASSEMBLY_ACC=CAM_ASM_000257 /TAXON_ID=200890 /ORGANISM="Paramoeba atlantica, Strain 621/1 / CCAP 1560/9" /LENGTH=316 /DNA_ID=CAMNT_0047877697 /DNA_START=226 /DNA_END=1176 /DNA_ORIENTATION=+